jgi:hypothetical protein
MSFGIARFEKGNERFEQRLRTLGRRLRDLAKWQKFRLLCHFRRPTAAIHSLWVPISLQIRIARSGRSPALVSNWVESGKWS